MNSILQTSIEARKWAKIYGFLFIALFAVPAVLQVLGFVLGIDPVELPDGQKLPMMYALIILAVSLVLGALAYFVPGWLLLRYCRSVTDAENQQDNPMSAIEQACVKQGQYFKYMGILSLIGLVLFVVLVVLSAVALPAYQQYVVEMMQQQQ